MRTRSLTVGSSRFLTAFLIVQRILGAQVINKDGYTQKELMEFVHVVHSNVCQVSCKQRANGSFLEPCCLPI